MLEKVGETSRAIPQIEITSIRDDQQKDVTSFHMALLDLNDEARVAILRYKDEISREIQNSYRISPEVQQFREQSEKAEPSAENKPLSANRAKLNYLEQLKDSENTFTRILTFRGVRRHYLRREELSPLELRKREERQHLDTQEFSLGRALLSSGTPREATVELAKLKIPDRVENQKARIKEVIRSLPDEITGGNIEKRTNGFLKEHGEIRKVMYDQYQVYNTLKIKIDRFFDRERQIEKPPLAASDQWLTMLSLGELSQLSHAVTREVTTLKDRYKSMTGKSFDAMTKIDTMNGIATKELETVGKDIYDRATQETLRGDRDNIVKSLIDDTTSLAARVGDMWTYGNSTAGNAAATLEGKRIEEQQKKI